jgi:predicted nucleic acid-binding protein
MIVVDSSIWIDHIHAPVPHLDQILLREHALMHPHVLGEIALGNIRNRKLVLFRLGRLPVPNVAKEGYVEFLIDEMELFGTGVGYTDAHLLAATRLTPDGQLWTRDKRLHKQAERLGVAYAAE